MPLVLGSLKKCKIPIAFYVSCGEYRQYLTGTPLIKHGRFLTVYSLAFEPKDVKGDWDIVLRHAISNIFSEVIDGPTSAEMASPIDK